MVGRRRGKRGVRGEVTISEWRNRMADMQGVQPLASTRQLAAVSWCSRLLSNLSPGLLVGVSSPATSLRTASARLVQELPQLRVS